MNNYFKILLVIVVSMTMGICLQKCQSHPEGVLDSECEVKTIICYDTIRYYEPSSSSIAQLGYKFISIPKFPDKSNTDTDSLPRIRADTEFGEIIIEPGDGQTDSVNLILPVVQNVYETDNYKAYISGVHPRLDSLFVYPKREIVTIRKPPKHWHIGPTIGYGFTPVGFQPYIGISITYSIFAL